MQTTKTSLLLGAMTPRELAAGRYLRDDQGHPPAVAPAANTNPAPEDEPSRTVDTSDKGKTTDQLYEEEYGTIDDDDAGDGPGDEGDQDDDDGNDNVEPKKPEGVSPEERIAQLEADRARLEAQLEEARRPRKEAEPPKEEKGEGDQNKGPKAPDPADYEFGDADARYIAALARFEADQRFDERMAERDTQQSIMEEYNTIVSRYEEAVSAPAIKEQYPDFDAVVNQGAAAKKWACTPEMAVLIKNSEYAPHVAYEIASNAELSAKMAQMSPQELLLEFGRVEGRVSGRASGQPAATPPKRASDAPPPPPNRARGSGGQYAAEQDTLYNQMLTDFD